MSRLGRGYPNNALMRSTVVIPPSFDSVGAGKTANSASLSWGHTFAANASALVFVGYLTNYFPQTITCSVGGIPMDFVTQQYFGSNGSGYDYGIAAFQLLSVPSGPKTVSLAFQSGSTNYAAANSMSYNNVASFDAYSYVTGSGTIASQTVTAANSQVIGQAFTNSSGAPNGFSGYSPNQRYEVNGISATSLALVMGDGPGTGNISFSATQASSTFGGVAIPMNGLAAA